MEELKMDETKPLNPFEQVYVRPRRKRNKVATVSDIPHRLDALPPEHDLTKRYEPKFLGKGGEHLVYVVKNHPDVVIKAQKESLAKTMALNKASGLETDADSAAVEELRHNKLLEERKRYQKLREVFGDHVLPQKFFVMEVPVGKAVRDELHELPNLYHLNIPEQAEAGWTIVSVQKRAEALKDESRLSMGGANLEVYLSKSRKISDPATRNLYRRVTDGLMDRESAESSDVNAEDLKLLMTDTRLRPLLQKAESDPDLAEVIADFQKKAVLFSEKNDDILDIAGRDNVVFHLNKHGAWTYTIIDGLYPFDTLILKKGREALVRFEMGRETTSMEGNAVFQSVNYVRVINGLGKILNTGAFIDFTPEEMRKREFSYVKHLIGEGKAA